MDTLHHSRRKNIANVIATTITAAAAGPVIHAITVDKTITGSKTTTDGAGRNHHLEVKKESHVHVEYHDPEDEHMMKYIMATTEVSQRDAVRKVLSSQTSFKDPLMMKYTMSGPESHAEPNHLGRPGVHADSLREKLDQLQQEQHPNPSNSRSPSPRRPGRVSPGRVSPSGLDHYQDNNVRHHHHHQHSWSHSGSNSSPHHCVDIVSCVDSCSSSDKLVDDHTHRVNSSRPGSRPRTAKDTYNEITETITQLHHDLELEKDIERQLMLSFSRRHQQQMNPELLKEYNNNNLQQRHGHANLGHS
ncbi:hypothetical protein BGZ80_006631 [Entomortierella chlamydospora]|uniref:Uncharacterized protein n=1 Tax=Entomortierella chlamydospora TaxID=101097 RepID=A0A9P6MGY0_9FUNG|nr:hypothetical protein BGZ79_004157 [Entomortierella chlamydospora]KAF9999167.1 hypothetical protein BGZ80_006631 [Entomortierella chlamydospora]